MTRMPDAQLARIIAAGMSKRHQISIFAEVPHDPTPVQFGVAVLKVSVQLFDRVFVREPQQ